MLGLRTGDFYAQKVKLLVRVQSTTTHPAFVEMMKNTFGKYSNVSIYKFFNRDFNSWQWFIYSDLNNSFSFILKKPQEIPEWILNNKEYFYAFLAGYMDCEGSWVILKSHENSVRFVFKISTTDITILEEIKNKLNELDFNSYLYLSAKSGTRNKQGKKYNKNFYSLIVYRKSDVITLPQILLPLSRHKEKILKMNLIVDGVNKNWDEIKDEILQLRNEIKRN